MLFRSKLTRLPSSFAKALEDGVAFAKFFEQVAPGAACAHDPRHGLCKPSACSRLLALHRQACPGSTRPSVPTACRLMLFFLLRYCSTRGGTQQALAQQQREEDSFWPLAMAGTVLPVTGRPLASIKLAGREASGVTGVALVSSSLKTSVLF